MRCYFMNNGRIAAVENLNTQSDDDRIAEARGIFEKLGQQKRADGFEVWDGPRFVYRYPEQSQAPLAP